METQQHEEVSDRLTSTIDGSCDIIDENVSQDEKKGKKKTRRKKKSKLTGSGNGYGHVYSCIVVSCILCGTMSHTKLLDVNICTGSQSKSYGEPFN
jgi:hypothetical protein